MKITNLVLAALFIGFGVVQFNDPDPYLWVMLYFVVAAICAFAAFGYVNKGVLLGGILGCVIWTIVLLPEFINWVQMGMPSITEEMKTEEPHIEFTREFLGLFICIAVLGFLYLRRDKIESTNGKSHS